MTLDDHSQIHHIARMAVLAMCARGVALGEFETCDEVQKVVITVRRDASAPQPHVVMELFGTSGFPIGEVEL